MALVKICGLRTIEHALAAVTAGADLLGLVFAPSRRQISTAQAASLIAALRQRAAGRRVRFVGLFVNELPAHINTVALRCALDYVQLSGDEWPEQARSICRPVLKSLRLDGSPREVAWLDLCRQPLVEVESHAGVPGYRPASGNADLMLAPVPVLVDAHVPGAYGGTGTLANWEHAATLARSQALLLAGGLTPANVVAALRQVQPHGVDVSSGVEVEGVKDVTKIQAFVRAVRMATGAQDQACNVPV